MNEQDDKVSIDYEEEDFALKERTERDINKAYIDGLSEGYKKAFQEIRDVMLKSDDANKAMYLISKLIICKML